MLVIHSWGAVVHPRGHHCRQNASWSLQQGQKAVCETDDPLPNQFLAHVIIMHDVGTFSSEWYYIIKLLS